MKLNELVFIEKKLLPAQVSKKETKWVTVGNLVITFSPIERSSKSMSYWQYISGIIFLYEIWPIEFFLLHLLFFWLIDFLRLKWAHFFPYGESIFLEQKRKMIHLYLVIKVSSSFASVKPCQFILNLELQKLTGK